MSEKIQDSVLLQTIAGRTVQEGIDEALKAGVLVQPEEGKWQLPRREAVPSNWIGESRTPSLNCKFKMGLMFNFIYRRSRVPAGCEFCYKVKVVPNTLRELVAVRDVAHALPYSYKVGLDAPNSYTAGIYAAYFYLAGLDGARAAYAVIRKAIDGHPQLGQSTTIFIKRGCTEYEVHCGPSDRYTFSPELTEIESALLDRIELPMKRESSRRDVQQTFAHWIKTAYSLGDTTYLDFTAGRRLYPAVVRYSPDRSVPSE